MDGTCQVVTDTVQKVIYGDGSLPGARPLPKLFKAVEREGRRPKPLTVWTTTNCGKFLKETGIPDHLTEILEKPVCRSGSNS